MVYYRKYRPQKIADLDLPQVRDKLYSILSSKDLPHAYLFTGSKGLGKTSSARILAKAINCTNRNQEARIKNQAIEKNSKKNHDSQSKIHNSTIEPCNACEACISITNGSNIDVIEIDAASNGGVEEIRTLREKVKFAPSTLKYKVYIIDEVHMLSSGAFNALLKTLEEPPEHVIFILATTELWKLPSTIVSRTFQVLFEKPTDEELVESLKRIVKGEELEIEDGVLLQIAKNSDGAFRDGAKHLEELVLSSHGSKITQNLFDQTFKTHGVKEEIYLLLEAYSKRNAKDALEAIARMANSGVDFKAVFERLVDHLRGLLMMRNGIISYEKDIKGLEIQDIKNLLDQVNEAYSEMKFSVIPQLPLELVTVKFCILDSKVGEQSEKEPISNNEKNESVITKSDMTKAVQNPNASKNEILKDMIDELNKINKPGAALLRSAKSAEFDGSSVTIATPFPIHAERLKSEKVMIDLIKSAENIVGKKVEIKIEVNS